MARCPYCTSEIRIDQVHYIFDIKNAPLSKKLQQFLQPGKEKQQDNRFYNFWLRYSRTIPPNILSKRIVKYQADIEKEQAILSTSNMKRDESEGILPGQNADRSLEDVANKEDIVCEIQKETTDKLEPLCYVVYENGWEIARTRPVCPNCYNVLPKGMFKLPMIKVALAADKGDGKTCLALSWFSTLGDYKGGLNRNERHMRFTSMLEENTGVDDEFNQALKEFKDGICPNPTKAQFIPPIFLKLSYQDNKKEAIVGIYDAAGEVIMRDQGERELVSFMSYMDGIIYMVDPDKTGLRADTEDKYFYLENSNENIFIENACVLDSSEQMKKQSQHYQHYQPKTLGEVMQELCGRDTTTGLKNRSKEVLNALRKYVEDEKLKKMHVALAISKCDELRGNREIEKYNGGNILFEDNFDPNQEDVRIRTLERLFEERVFKLDAFEGAFKSWSGHMIAALGCRTEVPEETAEDGQLVKPRLVGRFAPIRAEEPLLKIIAVYAKEHGWND